MIETIIVADDSPTARMIIKRCLEIAGCSHAKILEAGDGAEALELAKTNQVDLLVTDLNMPNMDGSALLQHVKASPKLNRLPVLVISSTSNEANKAELKKKGAFAVLGKPISPALVATVIQNLTEQIQWS
ncbi:MAG: response regulator [bacterium]